MGQLGTGLQILGIYFFKTKLTHIEILKLCTFVNVNGLNPDILIDWCDKMNLHKDYKSQHDMIWPMATFETDPDRYKAYVSI